MTPFNANLRTARERAGITRQELADSIGISVSALGQYEQGRREPDLQKLVAIATALHVSVDDLLGYHVDEFDKAVALFKKATGRTAILTEAGVEIQPLKIGDMITPPETISKAAFLKAMKNATTEFDEYIRPRLLRDTIISHITCAYSCEHVQELSKQLDSFFHPLFKTHVKKTSATAHNSNQDTEKGPHSKE